MIFSKWVPKRSAMVDNTYIVKEAVTRQIHILTSVVVKLMESVVKLVSLARPFTYPQAKERFW